MSSMKLLDPSVLGTKSSPGFVQNCPESLQIDWAISLGKQEIVALTKDKILKKKKIGIGPVLIIGAGNFPLAYSTIGGDSIAALAAKNPIVVKAHPHHTGTSLTIAKIVIKILRKLKSRNCFYW